MDAIHIHALAKHVVIGLYSIGHRGVLHIAIAAITAPRQKQHHNRKRKPALAAALPWGLTAARTRCGTLLVISLCRIPHGVAIHVPGRWWRCLSAPVGGIGCVLGRNCRIGWTAKPVLIGRGRPVLHGIARIASAIICLRVTTAPRVICIWPIAQWSCCIPALLLVCRRCRIHHAGRNGRHSLRPASAFAIP